LIKVRILSSNRRAKTRRRKAKESKERGIKCIVDFSAICHLQEF
jgi:hypothetical protein